MDTKPYGGPTPTSDTAAETSAATPIGETGSQTDRPQAVDEQLRAQNDETSAGAAGATTNTDRPPALPAASETTAPALDPNWRCKCGRPSTIWPGYCDAHHVVPGTSGPAVTTGLGAEHLLEPEDFAPGEHADRLTALLSRHIKRLSAHLDSRQLRLADVPLVEKLLVLVEKIEAREQPAVADDSVTDAPYDGIAFSRKLAIFYANEPDAFDAFIVTLLEADRERVGPLRQQLRSALDAFEPTLKPMWRADPNEADEIDL